MIYLIYYITHDKNYAERKNRMKYCFLIAGLNSGGAERVMSSLINYLVDENEIYLVTFTNNELFYHIDSRIHHININYFLPKNGFNRKLKIPYIEIKRVIRLIKILKTINPDCVVSFCVTANIFNIIQKMVYKRVPCVVSERNDPTKHSKMIKLICRHIYKYADLIVCQSRFVEKYYLNTNGKTCVLPNPLLIKNIPDYNENIIRKNKIVTIGRLVEQKNQKSLIDAFSIIHLKHPEIILEIYGEGALYDDLLNHIRNLNLEKNIKLMGVKANVLECIIDAKLFILSSKFEGFPNVLLEAMSLGLPVISTDFSTGVARDLIKDGVNGFVVKVDDINDMATKSIEILENEKLQKQMSRNNLYVRENYTINKIGKDWKVTIDSVAKKRV